MIAMLQTRSAARSAVVATLRLVLTFQRGSMAGRALQAEKKAIESSVSIGLCATQADTHLGQRKIGLWLDHLMKGIDEAGCLPSLHS
jgi:hypothetical protein